MEYNPTQPVVCAFVRVTQFARHPSFGATGPQDGSV